jgi:hypothetical protein|tara:strand:+ start:370 stop:648 length:279 start_codon:yes stop_codon:yes gene_type:complete
MADKILESKFRSFQECTKKELSNLHETNRLIMVTIDNIRENHLAHMAEKISTMENKLGNLGTEISWLKKNQWFMWTTMISNLIGVIYIIIQR